MPRNPVHSHPRLPLEPAVGLLVGGTDVAHGTADALRVASGAGFSPKVNPLLVDVFPELVGEKREQVLLGGQRRGSRAQAHALGDPVHVRVHCDAVDHVKHLVEDDVCGLSTNAGERDQVFHGAGDFSAVFRQQNLGGFHAMLGLCAPEADGLDDLSDLDGIGGRHGWGVWPAAEQLGRDLIYRGVSSLRRKHNADEQGKRVVVIQRTLDAWIELVHASAQLNTAFYLDFL